MKIRAFAFDAVGTLLHPEPSVSQVYAKVGRRFGSNLETSALRERFRLAFGLQEAVDLRDSLRTNEARELRRWQEIVAQVLDETTDQIGCFDALYRHFGQPQAWRLASDAAEVLAELRRRGYPLALASNYDHRLHTVRAGFPELECIDRIVISSEVGWRKPSPRFFEILAKSLGFPSEEIAFVGDDLANDFEGARQAGMQAILYDPHEKYRVEPCIRSLQELI